MNGMTRTNWLRSVLVAACAVAVLLVAGNAAAYGRVVWKETTLKQLNNRAWKINLEMHLPKAPDIAHVPMKFEFKPKYYYERSMVDGDKIIERKVPMKNAQAIIETVTVGFMDPGTGKTVKRTRFSFKITRAHDFAAGEYTVTIRWDNKVVGRPQKLILGGENKVIDRRSITFAGGDDKKKKKDDQMKKVDRDGNVKDGDEGEEGSKDGEGGEGSGEGEKYDEYGELTEEEQKRQAEEDARILAEEGGDDDANAPPKVEEKPGGCGCRVPGSSADTSTGGGAALLPSLALLGLLWERRRRQRKRAA